MNENLADDLNVSKQNRDIIVSLQSLREALFAAQLSFVNAGLVVHARSYEEQILENEFRLQDAWGFERNENMIRFWKAPACSCPHMDNEERLGQDVGFVVAGDCIIHGPMVSKS